MVMVAVVMATVVMAAVVMVVVVMVGSVGFFPVPVHVVFSRHMHACVCLPTSCMVWPRYVPWSFGKKKYAEGGPKKDSK